MSRFSPVSMLSLIHICGSDSECSANNADLPGLRFSKDPANVAEENCLGLLAVGCDWWLKEKRDGGLLVLWNRKVSYI